MKTFNINDYVYVQITKEGWDHLNKTVGKDYVKHCVKPYEQTINGKIWYRLQFHHAFEILPVYGQVGPLFTLPNIMFDESALK